eukprot:328973_1
MSEVGTDPPTEVTDTIFGKIARKEIKADIVYEDELCLAFRDLNPQAPTHVLLIPKKPITQVSKATPDDSALLGHLMLKAASVARDTLSLGDGFRLVVNDGKQGCQSVYHLHVSTAGRVAFSESMVDQIWPAVETGGIAVKNIQKWVNNSS